MPENYAAKFKKFFGGFGSHDKGRGEPPPELAAPESPEQTALEPPEQTVSELSPTQVQPALEETDAFTVPIENPLTLVWDKYGQPGTPTLNPQLQTQEAGGDVPLKSLEASFNKILGQLATLSQRWLDMESSAAQARAESEATTVSCEAAAKAESPAAPNDGAMPGEKVCDSSQLEGTPVPEAENEPDGETSADDAPPAPLDVDEMGQVLVSGDGMAAWLFLLPSTGNGKHLSLEDGQALLQEAHVTAGIDQHTLLAAFTDKPYFRLCPVASGTPPTEGKDGWTEDHFSRDFVRSICDADDSGTVDYRAQSNVQSIEKDVVICDIYPPEEGTAGLRVDGAAIPPKPVKAAVVPAGSNTALSEDGTKLLSAMDGFLEFKGGVFNVKNLLNISSDVDYSTGNIDFRGDVAIQGDVREQFSVKATGNITINGLVEAAAVEAGGDVVISNGVSGNNQAVIRGTHVRAKHLENCTVYAENLESDYILTSRVFCSDSVLLTGGRGAIIGGQVVAANHIKACCIGTQSGRATEITLGVQPELREEMLANRKELVSIRSKAAELVKRVTYLKNRMESQRRPDTRSSAEIQAAGKHLIEMSEREKALLARQTELMDQLNKLNSCRLEGGTVYPGVKLTIGSAIRNIKTVIKNCTAIFDTEEHDIKFV